MPVPVGYEALRAYEGRTVAMGVRPDHVRRAGESTPLRVRASVVLVEALGSALLVHVELPGRPVIATQVLEALADGPEAHGRDENVVGMVASLEPDDAVCVGDTLELALDPRRLHFFDRETGQAIR